MASRHWSLRAGVVLVLVGLAAVATAALAAPVLEEAVVELRAARSEPARQLAALVTLVAAGALGVVALWLALATAWCVVVVLTSGAGTAGAGTHPLLTPWLVRLLVGAALGSGALAAPAAAAASGPATAGEPPQVLAGLPLPDRPTDDAVARVAPEAATRHTVVAGDSLWSITAARLPAGAPPARVDRGWRQLYDANRRLIGDDPHLIRPGTVLRLPGSLT